MTRSQGLARRQRKCSLCLLRLPRQLAPLSLCLEPTPRLSGRGAELGLNDTSLKRDPLAVSAPDLKHRELSSVALTSRRSFRVGWGPNGMLVHTFGQKAVAIKQLAVAMPGQSAAAVEGVSDSPATSEEQGRYKKQIEGALRVHFEHYKQLEPTPSPSRPGFGAGGLVNNGLDGSSSSSSSSGGDGDGSGSSMQLTLVKQTAYPSFLVPPVPALSPASSPAALSRLCNSYVADLDRSQGQEREQVEAAGKKPDMGFAEHSRHLGSVWKLVQALWAPEKGASSLSSLPDLPMSDYAELHARRLSVSQWLVDTVRDGGDSSFASSAPAATSSSFQLAAALDGAATGAEVFRLLTGYQIEEACEVAHR